MNQPPRIGLTGGIATGKSTFRRMFSESLGAEWFCADTCVGALLEKDPQTALEIREKVHPQAFSADGSPNRAFLRSLVFKDASARQALESVLHPKVRATWMRQATEAVERGNPFVADIPLLFETGVTGHFDAVVTVACSPEIQMARLLDRQGIDTQIAKKMIASQWPIESKIEGSTHVVWNDGDQGALSLQSDFLARLFHVRPG